MALALPVLASGNGFLVTHSIVEARYSGGSPTTLVTTSNFYDGHGNLIRAETETDWTEDGISDAYEVLTQSFDAQQRLILRVNESDLRRGPSQLTRETSEFTYPNRDQQREVRERDLGGDGSVEQTFITTSTFDHRDNPLVQVVESYGPAGDAGTNIVTRTYDHRGFPLLELTDGNVLSWTYDDRNDRVTFGLTDVATGNYSELVYSMDKHRNLLSTAGSVFDPNVGLNIGISDEHTYDKHGNLKERIARFIFPSANGPLELTEISTYFYAPRGVIVAAAQAD